MSSTRTGTDFLASTNTFHSSESLIARTFLIVLGISHLVHIITRQNLIKNDVFVCIDDVW